jgi:hypothetical protein
MFVLFRVQPKIITKQTNSSKTIKVAMINLKVLEYIRPILKTFLIIWNVLLKKGAIFTYKGATFLWSTLYNKFSYKFKNGKNPFSEIIHNPGILKEEYIQINTLRAERNIIT